MCYHNMVAGGYGIPFYNNNKKEDFIQRKIFTTTTMMLFHHCCLYSHTHTHKHTQVNNIHMKKTCHFLAALHFIKFISLAHSSLSQFCTLLSFRMGCSHLWGRLSSLSYPHFVWGIVAYTLPTYIYFFLFFASFIYVYCY